MNNLWPSLKLLKVSSFFLFLIVWCPKTVLGQDFVGVLKGDADFSWQIQCNTEKQMTNQPRPKLEFVLSPIPAADQVQIDYLAPEHTHLRFEIMDLKGQLILAQKSSGTGKLEHWTWNRLDQHATRVAGGVYFLRSMVPCQSPQTQNSSFFLKPFF